MTKKSVFLFVTVLVIASTLLTACQPTATVSPTVPPASTAVPTAVPSATAVPQITITYWAFGTEGSTMTGGGLWSDCMPIYLSNTSRTTRVSPLTSPLKVMKPVAVL